MGHFWTLFWTPIFRCWPVLARSNVRTVGFWPEGPKTPQKGVQKWPKKGQKWVKNGSKMTLFLTPFLDPYFQGLASTGQVKRPYTGIWARRAKTPPKPVQKGVPKWPKKGQKRVKKSDQKWSKIALFGLFLSKKGRFLTKKCPILGLFLTPIFDPFWPKWPIWAENGPIHARAFQPWKGVKKRGQKPVPKMSHFFGPFFKTPNFCGQKSLSRTPPPDAKKLGHFWPLFWQVLKIGGSKMAQKRVIFDPFLTLFWPKNDPKMGHFWGHFWGQNPPFLRLKWVKKGSQKWVKNGVQKWPLFWPLFWTPFWPPKPRIWHFTCPPHEPYVL